jgi:hypothetical protein
MISMQYGFALPADYDMSIIERRIREKGPGFDGLAGLEFKAFMMARKDDPVLASSENLYAPLYLWRTVKAMEDFLVGPMFRTVSGAFGWPSVRLWTPLAQSPADAIDRIASETFVTRELSLIAPHRSLEQLRQREADAVQTDAQRGAVYALSAFDPTSWMLARFRIWKALPEFAPDAQVQRYRVLHVSRGT